MDAARAEALRLAVQLRHDNYVRSAQEYDEQTTMVLATADAFHAWLIREPEPCPATLNASGWKLGELTVSHPCVRRPLNHVGQHLTADGTSFTLVTVPREMLGEPLPGPARYLGEHVRDEMITSPSGKRICMCGDYWPCERAETHA